MRDARHPTSPSADAIKIDVEKGFKTGVFFDRFLVAKMVTRRAAKSALVFTGTSLRDSIA